MIGVKYFPPIPPKLEIVKVPPERSFGLSALDLALSLISASSTDKSKKIFLSTQKVPTTDDVQKKDIYRVGAIGNIIQMLKNVKQIIDVSKHLFAGM